MIINLFEHQEKSIKYNKQQLEICNIIPGIILIIKPEF